MQTKRVFLVEDELLVAMEIMDLIDETGFGTIGPYTTVSGANEALKSETPACAVLDVRLRDGEIYPVADELSRRGVPLIFHSGHATAAQLGERYPGAILCEKPCTPRSLSRAIVRMTSEATGAGKGRVDVRSYALRVPPQTRENGGAKFDHGSGGVMRLRAA